VAQLIDNNGAFDPRLRTRGSWVQVLPGAPKFKDLAAKTRSSLLLWDRCGTAYPPVRADAIRLKHFASKTKSSFLSVESCGTSYPARIISVVGTIAASSLRPLIAKGGPINRRQAKGT
jgi:hypothetical protein